MTHFSDLARIISEMTWEVTTEPLQVKLVKDEIEALILLLAVEETLTHYCEDVVAASDPPLKDRMREMLEEEQKHRDEMQALIQEAKAALSGRA